KAFMNYPVETYRDFPETDTSYPARLARAIAHYKDLDTDKALSLVDDLIKEQPTNPYLYEFKGQILFERGRAKDAVAPLRKAVELAPKAPLIAVSFAQALLASRTTDDAKEALGTLNLAVNLDKENVLGWRLLAQAYDLNGEPTKALLANAEGNFAQGNMIDA